MRFRGQALAGNLGAPKDPQTTSHAVATGQGYAPVMSGTNRCRAQAKPTRELQIWTLLPHGTWKNEGIKCGRRGKKKRHQSENPLTNEKGGRIGPRRGFRINLG